MKNEIEKIDPKDFGLQENEVQTIEAAFMPKIVERDGIKPLYEQLISQEITPVLCSEAKNLRLKLVKVRTGIAEIHKTQKAFFLAAGRFVDAWKNKETLPISQMEENLEAIEKHYERIEAERIAALQTKRAAEIASFQEVDSFIPGNLGELTDEVYANYLLGVKTAFEQKKEAERIAAEKEAERIASEKAENERIRVENERLKKEQAELEAKAKAERKAAKEAADKAEAEAAKLRAELEAKAEAERKAKAEQEAKEQAELAKGDAEKVKDLIAELETIKAKYVFKSKKNQKMYSDIQILLDKVINHINK